MTIKAYYNEIDMTRDDFQYAHDRYPVLPPDANGYRSCRVCKDRLTDKRRRVCSNCAPEYNAIPDSWAEARDMVFQRDKGICAVCGRDTEALLRVLEATRPDPQRPIYSEYVFPPWEWEARALRIEWGFRERGVLWDCDHANPVSIHGPAKTIDELRTLCTPCHRRVTVSQATDRAVRRRPNSCPAKAASPQNQAGQR